MGKNTSDCHIELSYICQTTHISDLCSKLDWNPNHNSTHHDEELSFHLWSLSNYIWCITLISLFLIHCCKLDPLPSHLCSKVSQWWHHAAAGSDLREAGQPGNQGRQKHWLKLAISNKLETRALVAVDVSNTQMGSFSFNQSIYAVVNGSLCSCQYLPPILDQDGHEVNWGGGCYWKLMLRGLEVSLVWQSFGQRASQKWEKWEVNIMEIKWRGTRVREQGTPCCVLTNIKQTNKQTTELKMNCLINLIQGGINELSQCPDIKIWGHINAPTSTVSDWEPNRCDTRYVELLIYCTWKNSLKSWCKCLP